MKLNENKITKTILEVCVKIAKRGEGALIVLGDADFDKLVNQDIKPFNIVKNPKTLEALALIDGAVIVDKEGVLKYYGVKLKAPKVLKNFGTRHSAGISASRKDDVTVFLVSEEERKVKIFKKGKIIMQIDALEKNIEQQIPKITRVLESIGVGTASTIGLGVIGSVLGVAVGITFIQGVLVFGSGYYLVKKMKEWQK